jgi:hypothetical protein
VIGGGHHRLAARFRDGVGNLGAVSGHGNPTDRRRDRPPPDMDDHRHSVDLGERLAGKAGCRHACGD